ncbi:MAG: PRC-barrel domain-containing protein [Jatrophihabitans sp.]
MTLSGDVASGLSAPRLVLIAATSINGLPVVSIPEGEVLAKIKDVIYSPDAGHVLGFTLNKASGLLAGPLKTPLALSAVHSIGRDAVMVEAASLEEAAAAGSSEGGERQRNVLGNDVLTDAGQRLGQVTDLIVAAGVMGSAQSGISPGDVVGYQLAGDEALQGRGGAAMFVPLPYALSVSGTALMVPASVEPYIRDDLSGFGGALEQFRAMLTAESAPGAPPADAPAPTPPAAPAPARESQS